MKKLIVALFSILSASAFSGVRDIGNGGDAVVLEFKTYAAQVVKDIKNEAFQIFPEFTLVDLEYALERTEVVSVDKTILEGIEKDAINYPTRGLIEISRSRWQLKSNTPDQIRALVLHEYLGIMNIDDGDYKISQRLVEYYRDSKKKLDLSELRGRLFITSQLEASTQGLVTINQATLTFAGLIQGIPQNCLGNYTFDYDQQILSSDVVCDGLNTIIKLNFWNTDVVDFLRRGMIDIYFSFEQASNVNYKNYIEAKKLP